MPSFRMHFLTAAADGPIVSGPGPDLPAEVQAELGRKTLGGGGRFVVACDPAILLSDLDRGTGVPYAVACPRCRATAAFKAQDRPHPRDLKNDGEAETEGNPIRPCAGCQ